MSSLNLENTSIGDDERRRRLATAYRIILSAARRKRGEQKDSDAAKHVSLFPSATGVESHEFQEVQN